MKSLFFTLFYFSTLVVFAQNPQEILHNSLEKLGGKSAWAKVKNTHLIIKQTGDNARTIEVYFEFPYSAYFYNQYTNERQNLKTGINNGQAWVQKSDKSVATFPNFTTGEANFIGLLFYYADSLNYKIELLEDKIINGKLCYQLLIERKLPITVFIDQFTNLPVATKDAKSYTIFDKFSIYEPLGIWVETFKSNRLSLKDGIEVNSRTIISSISFNVELPEGIFEAPKQ